MSSTTYPSIRLKTDSIIEAKSIQPLRTGIVFEPGSLHFDRANRLHKERPVRVTSIMDALEKSDIHSKLNILQENDIDPSSPEKLFLEDDDYLQVHLPGYMKRLNKLSNCSCCEKLDREAEQFKSIYFTKNSVAEAKTAATSLCRLVTKVVDGDLDNGFAVIRPPGHHAEPGAAGGYCVINNVAIAASYAREKLGLAKVLIVDWDVHHGNGTQAIFLNDPNVLYFSVHRWHGGNYYPFLQNSGPNNVGLGDGQGFNVNVGWSRKGMGNDEYIAVWEKVLMPIAREFQPDLVLVSAGFDAALGDMGECNVTPECFGRLTRSLMTLANGKVVCALEGGYVRSVLAKCVESVVTNLLDCTSPQVSETETKEDVAARDGVDVLDTIDNSAAKSILATIAAHESYWPCLGKPLHKKAIVITQARYFAVAKVSHILSLVYYSFSILSGPTK
jgi:histone deacetylase 6